jgi:hypothetical protein
VVVLSPAGDAVLLNNTMWASYREIAGKVSPENAVVFGGYPAEVERRSDPDAVVVHLDRGGYVVGRRDGTWQCLGGDGVVAADALPGWAVATLPLGAPATCPGAQD